MENKLELPEIKINTNSKIAKCFKYAYNILLCLNSLLAIVLTFIDDEWKESHNFDLITKFVIWGLGVLVFLWFVFNLIIPSVKKSIFKIKYEKQPHKIKKQLDKLEKRRQDLINKIKSCDS